MIHAAKTRVVEPTARAMSLVTRKMPVPMVSPMTMAVADRRPKPRTKWDCLGRSASSGSLGVIEVREPTIRHREGQIGAGDRKNICPARARSGGFRVIIAAAMAAQKSMLSEYRWDPAYA